MMAKRFFEKKNIEFEDTDVSNAPEMRRNLMELSGMRTVPQIFIDGKSIGGYTDMMALERAGELDRLLNAK